MKKLAAIKTLIKQGNHGDEWREAGLLRAVEEIVDSSKEDFSSKEILDLIEQAKKF